MIDALAPMFVGPLAWLQDRVLLAEDAPSHAVAASDLFTPAGLDRVIDMHAIVYPPGDRRALLSIWSKYYLATMVYTPFAAQLLLGRTLPVELDRISLVLAETGEVEQLVLPHAGESYASKSHAGESVTDADAAARFLPLIDANLGPAIDIMAAHSGLSPRVYWSNAGHYVDHVAQTLATLPNTPPAVHDLSAMMNLRRLADGRRNPLFQPLQDMTDAHGRCHRMRRLCCVRFQLPGVGYCENCPLELERPVRR